MWLSLGSRGLLVGTAAIALAVGASACGTTTLKTHPDGGNQAGGTTGAGGSTANGAGGTTDTGGGGSAGTTGVGGGPGGATGAGGQVDAAVDVLPTCAGTICSVAFASDASWPTYDGDPASTPTAHVGGSAQPVCLNQTAPPSCPPGALLYGHPGGWSFSLASIPGAEWVWAPGIAATDISDLRKVYLSRTFSLGTAPGGQISIAADDSARVLVNGTDVGGVGSITDVTIAGTSNTRLTTIDISVALHPGSNTITIAAQNGPASFAGCPTSCTYQMNPAGVVFGGTLSYH